MNDAYSSFHSSKGRFYKISLRNPLLYVVLRYKIVYIPQPYIQISKASPKTALLSRWVHSDLRYVQCLQTGTECFTKNCSEKVQLDFFFCS